MNGPSMVNLSHRLRRCNFADDVEALFAEATGREWRVAKKTSYNGLKVFGPHMHGLAFRTDHD